MTKRKYSIEAMISRSEEDIASIELTYHQSLKAKEISPDLKIEIKNLCGNLRSALDYLATDIREIFCPEAMTDGIFYFPILSVYTQFRFKMASWFPDLATKQPALWSYLESVQPYHTRYEWIARFNKLNNENKHDDLVEQIRTESQEVRVTTENGNQASWNRDALTFSEGVIIGGVPVDPKTQLPVPNPSQKVEIVVWVDFQFSGIEGSALHLLKQSLVGISKIIDGAYSLFPQT